MVRPDASCVVITLFAIKLCVFLVVCLECFRLVYIDSALIQAKVHGVPMWALLTFFAIISMLMIIIETFLLIISFTKHVVFAKKLVVHNTWIQCFVFAPFYIVMIILFATLSDKNVDAYWKSDFVEISDLVNNFTFIQFDDFNVSNLAPHSGIDGYTPELAYKLGVLKDHVDTVQRELKCCGLDSPLDWLQSLSNYPNEAEQNGVYLWWTSSPFQEAVPESCCVHGFDGHCTLVEHDPNITNVYSTHISYRATTGCWHTLITFITRFNLAIAVLLLLMVIISIPRNVFLYYFVEVRRRVQRALECKRHAAQLRHENETLINTTQSNGSGESGEAARPGAGKDEMWPGIVAFCESEKALECCFDVESLGKWY